MPTRMSLRFWPVRVIASWLRKWALPGGNPSSPGPVVSRFFDPPSGSAHLGGGANEPRLYILPKNEDSMVVVWHAPEKDRLSIATLHVFEGVRQVREVAIQLGTGAFHVTGLTASGCYRAELHTQSHGIFRSERELTLPNAQTVKSSEVRWARLRLEEGKGVLTQVHSQFRPHVEMPFSEDTVSSSRVADA